MVVLTIDTIGEERFIRGFNRYVEDMKDFTPIFEQIADWFYSEEKMVFTRQGDPEKFFPLSPRYKAWKDKHYPGKPIMQLRGRLMASLTGKGDDVIKKIGKKEAEYGTSAPYAHRHQMGTMGMPKRKIVQLTEARKRTIGRMIHQWSFDQLKERIA